MKKPPKAETWRKGQAVRVVYDTGEAPSTGRRWVCWGRPRGGRARICWSETWERWCTGAKQIAGPKREAAIAEGGSLLKRVREALHSDGPLTKVFVLACRERAAGKLEMLRHCVAVAHEHTPYGSSIKGALERELKE
jgi:hypothetical protein